MYIFIINIELLILSIPIPIYKRQNRPLIKNISHNQCRIFSKKVPYFHKTKIYFPLYIYDYVFFF